MATDLLDAPLLPPTQTNRYENTERRQELMAKRGIFHIGMGVSGGEEGARNGADTEGWAGRCKTPPRACAVGPATLQDQGGASQHSTSTMLGTCSSACPCSHKLSHINGHTACRPCHDARR